jgi:SIR2-like domain
MAGSFYEDRAKNDREWDQLLGLIQRWQCVPFLGAGACVPHLPLAAPLAGRLADALGDYPWEDKGNLVRVAQYAAVTRQPLWVKTWVADELRKVTPPARQPGGAAADEPHRVLTDLPLPLYVTTNYDHFMFAALAAHEVRRPYLELCRWNRLLAHEPGVFKDQPDFPLSPATPVVFHLHGHLDKPVSMVLTEDDYLDFLEAMIRRGGQLLPGPVARQLEAGALLFIGYGLGDWNFRLLLRSLKEYAVAASYLVLKPPEGATANQVRGYFDEFYRGLELRVFWGTAQEFSGELARRWAARRAAGA